MDEKSGYGSVKLSRGEWSVTGPRRDAPGAFVLGAPQGEVDEGAIVPLADGGTALVSFTGKPTRVVPKGETAVLYWGSYATLTIGA